MRKEDFVLDWNFANPTARAEMIWDLVNPSPTNPDSVRAELYAEALKEKDRLSESLEQVFRAAWPNGCEGATVNDLCAHVTNLHESAASATNETHRLAKALDEAEDTIGEVGRILGAGECERTIDAAKRVARERAATLTPNYATVASLSRRLGRKSTELLMKLLTTGRYGVHINSPLSDEDVRFLEAEFGAVPKPALDRLAQDFETRRDFAPGIGKRVAEIIRGAK